MAEEAPKTQNPPTSAASEIAASARSVGDAAKAGYTQQTDKISKANISKAAGDALEATKGGIVQSVDKAQVYLQKFQPPSDEATAAPVVAEKESVVDKVKSTAVDVAEKVKSTAADVVEKKESVAPEVAEKKEAAAPDVAKEEATGGVKWTQSLQIKGHQSLRLHLLEVI